MQMQGELHSHRGRWLLVLAMVAVLDIAAGTAICMLTDSVPGVVTGVALILGSLQLGIATAVLGRRDLAAMRHGGTNPAVLSTARLAYAGGLTAAILSSATAAYLIWFLVQIGKLAWRSPSELRSPRSARRPGRSEVADRERAPAPDPRPTRSTELAAGPGPARRPPWRDGVGLV